MGDLNLGQYQSAVRRALDNLRAGHPAIVAGDHTRCINDAANDLIRWYPNHFPEHHNRTWTDGPTTVSANSIALPSNLIELQRVVHSNGATITSGDWSSTKEVLVSPITAETIGLAAKSSTQPGYPTLWDRKGYNLLYWPTTRTGYTTTFRFYGISGETRLSAGGDTFRMHRDFDQAIILLGASKLAVVIGWTERALELEAAARRVVTSGKSVVGRERANKPNTVTAALCPR